MAWFVILL